MNKKITVFSLFVLIVKLGLSQSGELVYNDLGLALNCPDSVFILDLSNRNLETLPAAVVKFKNLRHLDISGNNISKMPYYISELQNLEFLDISKMPMLNLLDALEKISEMENLNSLEISESGGKEKILKPTSNYKIHRLILSANGSI